MKLAGLLPTGSDPTSASTISRRGKRRGPPPINLPRLRRLPGRYFPRDISTLGVDETVLLLLGSRLGLNLRLLEKMKASGWTVLTAFKENGLSADSLEGLLPPAGHEDSRDLLPGRRLRKPHQGADARLQSSHRVTCCLHPDALSIDDPRWDFSVPVENRKGIFVGTREFFNPARNHLFSLILLKRYRM